MNPVVKTSCLMGLFLLAGCETEPKSSSVEFMLAYNGKPMTCEQTFEKEGLEWQLRAFQFYLSEVEIDGQAATLKNKSGEASPVAMLGTRCSGEGRWQFDMEPMTVSDSSSFSFMLGVPFEVNHQNPLQASEPLNHSDMFWTWQIGHKFVRMDIRSQTEEKSKSWAFHLGSIGCDSASSVRAPTEACAHPNTFTVTLDDFQSDKPVYFHVDRLIANSKIIEDGNCMGDPDDASCKPLIQVLSEEQSKSHVFSQTL